MMREDAQQNVENSDSIIRQIREADHPMLMSDFCSSRLIEVLKQWLKNDYQISVEEITTTLEVIFKLDSSENK